MSRLWRDVLVLGVLIIGVAALATAVLVRDACADTVEVVPGLEVDARDAPKTALFLRTMALESGRAVEVDGELVTWTLDLHTWQRLAWCESRGDWSQRGVFRGGLQFLRSTWNLIGGEGDPADAPIDEQIRRARDLQAIAGWTQWPGCARKLGLT